MQPDISIHSLHQEHRERPHSEQSPVGAYIIFMKFVLPNDIVCFVHVSIISLPVVKMNET